MSSKKDDEGCLVFLGIIVFFIFLYFVLKFIIRYWIYVLSISILLVVFYIYTVYKRNKEDAKRAEAELKRKQEEKRLLMLDICEIGFWNLIYRGVPTSNRNDTNRILNEILKYPIIIDTSIWMDEKLTDFWMTLYSLCKHSHIKIFIPSTVYDEILRIHDESNNVNKKIAFMSLSNPKVLKNGIGIIKGVQETISIIELAQKRIKDFSDSDLLHIVFLHGVAKTESSACLDIISMCQYIQDNTKSKMFSLITNNDELILRTRHFLNENSKDGNTDVCKILSVGYTRYTEKWDEYKFLT